MRHRGFSGCRDAQDNSQVVLYTDDASLLPDYPLRRSPGQSAGKRPVQVSLIASARNEADNAEQWVRSVFAQTRLPDEIIVTETGSANGTLELLTTLARQSPVPFRVISRPGANVAAGRNSAISAARYPIIACTDFGCRPRPDWLERIIAPFELEPATQVAGGLYAAVDGQGRPLHRRAWISLERIRPAAFLPPACSVAFARQAWEAVGGFPEWLTMTGEDTCFDLELKRRGGAWGFVPEAVVEWQAPEGTLSYWRKLYQWSRGDGEAALQAGYYWEKCLHIMGGLAYCLVCALFAFAILIVPVEPIAFWMSLLALIWLAGIVVAARLNGIGLSGLVGELGAEVARILGFFAGLRRHREALNRRLSSLDEFSREGAAGGRSTGKQPFFQPGVKGIFFVLSGVPIDDTGGGARAAQIALELLNQDFAVVFMNRFARAEGQDLGLKVSHPNLITDHCSRFPWEHFLQQAGSFLEGRVLGAIVEVPVAEFLPLVRGIRRQGGVVVYDLMDAWDTSLGKPWYSETIEKEVIQCSQLLVATAPLLVRRLERLSGRGVSLLPNAVNDRLFDPGQGYPRPSDLPAAAWTAMYVGALWGEWFDWDLLLRIGRQNPEAAVVVIGDYRGQCRNAPSNLYFLGLKAQKDLPAYLARADVGIVPWKIGPVTRATSPLKVYEFLAMQRPVVAPRIDPLEGIPGVFLAQNGGEFLDRLAPARQSPFPKTEATRFIEENNWRVRVERLVELVRSQLAIDPRPSSS